MSSAAIAVAEGKRRQDRKLVRRVVALDVEGRIGFGIAEALRFLQAVREGQALLLHLGQDVVAGAVHDAVDARNRVAGQRFAQRLDDRNAAGDGRFEIQQRALLLGDRRQVRRRDRQAAPCWLSPHGDRARAPRARRRWPRRSAPPISSTKTSISAFSARSTGRSNHSMPDRSMPRSLVPVACRDGRDLDRPAAGDGKLVAAALNDTDERSTNGAQARNADFEGICHGSILTVSCERQPPESGCRCSDGISDERSAR